MKKKKKRLPVWAIILIVIASLLLLATAVLGAGYLYGGSRIQKRIDNKGPVHVEVPDEIEAETEYDGAVVYYNGEKYEYNEDIVTVLFCGIDKWDLTIKSDTDKIGQADAIFLFVLNPDKDKADVISIPRESMTDVNMYSLDGKFLKTDRMQLCLSFAYGDGGTKSMENVIRSVGRLLYGVPVTSYLGIDFEAISILNDMVGGVTVPEYTKDWLEKTGNMVTLKGKQAMLYTSKRNMYSEEASFIRLERQKYYISAFKDKAIEKTREDLTFPVSLLSACSDYSITDLNVAEISYLAANYLDAVANMKQYTVSGTTSVVDQRVQFEVDNKALYETVLELFYDKK